MCDDDRRRERHLRLSRERSGAPRPVRISARLAGNRDFRWHAALFSASRPAQSRARAQHDDPVDPRKLRRHPGADAGVRLCLRRLREGGGSDDGVLGPRFRLGRAAPHVCGGHQSRQSVHWRHPSQDRAPIRQLPMERRRSGRAQLQGRQLVSDDDLHRWRNQPAGGGDGALVPGALLALRGGDRFLRRRPLSRRLRHRPQFPARSARSP